MEDPRRVGAVEDLAPLVVGRDPRDIEQLVRVLTKHSFWRLGVIGMTAISGIEMACGTSSARSLGVPVWRLLGGRTRDRVPVYTHLGLGEMTAVYESLDEAPLVERAREVVERGYRALKVVFIPYTHYTASRAEVDKVGRAAWARSARRSGEEVEIMVDFHGRLRLGLGGAAVYRGAGAVPAAVRRGALAAGRDPGPGRDQGRRPACRSPPASGWSTGASSTSCCAPVPSTSPSPTSAMSAGFGEAQEDRGHGRGRELRGGAAQPAGPDRRRGGAALRRRDAQLRHPGGDGRGRALVRRGRARRRSAMVDGCWQVPEAPGLGIEVDEREAAKHPFEQEVLHTSNAVLADGTVVDW